MLRTLRTILEAFSEPNFANLTIGHASGQLGVWIQRFAAGWLAWELTKSGAWLGIVAFADLFPTVIIGPFAGAAADRWNRLTLLKVSQFLAAVQATVLFVLVATDHITIIGLVILVGLQGVIDGFNVAARLSLLPSVVKPGHLPAAVAINSIVSNVARFVGPALAGLMITLGDTSLAFLANALTHAIFFVALWWVTVPPAELVVEVKNSFAKDLANGFRYTASHPGIATLMLLMIATTASSRPIMDLMPGFAARIFETGADGLALLSSSIGVGAIFGGFLLGVRANPEKLIPLLLMSCLLLSLTTIAFTATSSLYLAVPILALLGACMALSGIAAQTSIQLSVDARMRGRVIAFYGMIMRGAPSVGALVMGFAAEFFGFRAPVAVGALVLLLVLLWAFLRRDVVMSSLKS